MTAKYDVLSEPPVEIPVTGIVQFDTLLNDISRQAKVTFVIEGYPLKNHTLSKGVNKSDGELPVEQVVSKIADLFDYDVTSAMRTPGHPHKIFILKKRYTNPYDLPCVTLEEYLLSMHDVSRIMQPYLPHPAWTTNNMFSHMFEDSLDTHQKQMLQAGKLSVSLLTQGQQSQVRRMALHSFTGIRNRISQESLFVLEQSEQIAIGSDKSNEIAGFGYNYHDVYQRDAFRPFNGVVQKEQHDNDWNNAGYNVLKPELKDVTWSQKQTLGSEIESLNSRTNDGLTAEVEPALSAKPITVVGANYSSPSSILEALAYVYGLRVTKEKQGYVIRRPHIQYSSTVADLNRSIQHSIPEPLLRAIRPKDLPHIQPPSLNSSFPLLNQRLNASRKPVLIVQKALWRLQEVYNLELLNRSDKSTRPQPNNEISISTLSAEARSAFAVTVLQDYLTGLLSTYNEQVPPTITKMSDGYLTGGIYERNGKKFYTLLIKVDTLRTDGSTDTNIGGFSDVPWSETPRN